MANLIIIRNDIALSSNSAITPTYKASEVHNVTISAHIEDELFGAEQYYQLYKSTGDENYKRMAYDEIRHAEFFLKRAYNQIPAAELAQYQSEIDRLLHLITKG